MLFYFLSSFEHSYSTYNNKKFSNANANTRSLKFHSNWISNQTAYNIYIPTKYILYSVLYTLEKLTATMMRHFIQKMSAKEMKVMNKTTTTKNEI